MRFQLNANEVVHELLDGEIIVMHLLSGNYYSLVGSGAEIWSAVIAGTSSGAIVARLIGEVTAEPELVELETRNFLQQLVDESLILPVADGSADPESVLAESANAESSLPGALRQPFKSPTIQKYTDMQGLLLVDPIHEVDASGWPATISS